MKIALITSTIQPSAGTFALKRSRVEDRLQDYQKAFAFYCDCLAKNVFDQMVYVDNSGYPLDSLKKIAADKNLSSKIEFISYTSTVPVKDNSRFFLEIHLIKHFIENSTFLKQSPECTIWKITGRYLITNIDQIIRKCHAAQSADVYMNFRNHPSKVIDFYLVGMTLKAWTQLFSTQIGLYEGPRDGELILREYLDAKPHPELAIMKRLPVTPRIFGVRGFDAGTYGGGKDSLKFFVRSAANVLWPSLWI